MSKFVVIDRSNVRAIGGPKPTQLVEIGLENSIKFEQRSGGILVLSPHLMTPAEVDSFIDGLIEDLEQIRQAAKTELKRQFDLARR